MRLNLGCGANLFEGWLNVDIDDVEETYLRHLRSAQNVDGWPEWQRRQWSFLRGGGAYDLAKCDFMESQPMAAIRIGGRMFTESCEAIYLGQVVEHLNPVWELPALLKRCYGALKPGGVLRMTTPDLEEIIHKYNMVDMLDFASEQPAFYAEGGRGEGREDDRLAYLLFGASGPNCTRKNYEGHMHCYSRASLSRRVREAGFTGEIDFSWPSNRLPDVRDFGESHSFAFETVKP